MENAEEIFHYLEDFSKRKPKTIPQELNDYLAYVARTGDPVYQWSLVKCLFKEKLLNVITDFYETSSGIPPYPNVDPFNYDVMKNSLLERLDSFTSAPFTVQRICELLTCPRKLYNRVDKYMRAVEKNILVVSTREPGAQRHPELENGEPMEPIVNGSDNNSDYNVDVEMEDMSWKEKAEQQKTEPQPSSSDAHISVDEIEARLQAKQEAAMDTSEKVITEYESVTPPEPNLNSEETEMPTEVTISVANISKDTEPTKTETTTEALEDQKIDVEMKSEVTTSDPLIIPEIKVEDAEMTEQRLNEETKAQKEEPVVEKKPEITETKETETQQISADESSSDSSNTKEEAKPISEVSTSSEESSSSSDNADGNSNSPKTDSEPQIDIQDESNPSDNSEESDAKQEDKPEETTTTDTPKTATEDKICTDDYSISDVNSELPQPTVREETSDKLEEPTETKEKSEPTEEPDLKNEKEKTESDITEEKTENKEV